jgi:hypothetical protein
MPDIRLPDGSIARFPAGTSDAEIAAALRQRFPPPRPRPTTLQPGERELRDNGAEIVFVEEFSRYAVYDVAGTLRGFRPTLDEAIDLADSIQPPPPPRVKPKPAPQLQERISPLAAERQIAAEVDRSIRLQESRDRRARVAERRAARYKNRGTT